jgi:hypothetical protein
MSNNTIGSMTTGVSAIRQSNHSNCQLSFTLPYFINATKQRTKLHPSLADKGISLHYNESLQLELGVRMGYLY